MAAGKTLGDYGIDLPRTYGSGEVYVRCPKCDGERRHKGRKPLGVNPEKQAWYCWHCHRSGSVARGGWKDDPGYGRQDEPERRTYLPPRELKPAAADKQQLVLSQVEMDRRIGRGVLAEHGVEIVDRWCKECEDWVPQIAFPYVKAGKHVHTKYRCQAKHFGTDKGTERVLYLYDRLFSVDPWTPIIITEGEFDALALRSVGYSRVVSVPDGVQALTARRKARAKAKAEGAKYEERSVALPYLDDARVAETLMSSQTVILALDSDEDGQELEAELARRIGFGRCKRVRWQSGVKDANQCLSELGDAALREAIEGAEPYPVEGLIVLPDYETLMDRFRHEGLPKGISTGWRNLDHYVRVMLGQFWVVFGPTSSGKSHWVNAFVRNLIVSQGWGAGLCSPEWQPVAMHAISLLETHLGKPFDRFVNPSTAMSDDEYDQGKRWLDDHVTFILPKDRSVATLINRMKLAVLRRGVKVFVIDPWFTLHHENEGDMLAYIDSALSEIGEFFMESQTLGILVVHPTKQPAQKIGKDGNKVVTSLGVYGPSQSAAFANRADVEIEIARVTNGVSRLWVQKVRSRYQGTEGHVDLMFDVDTGRYSVPEGEYLPTRWTDKVQEPEAEPAKVKTWNRELITMPGGTDDR